MLQTLSTPSSARWSVRLATLVLWTAAAAVVAFWVLKFAGLSGQASQAPTVARSTPAELSASDVQKALGAVSNAAVVATPDAGSRFALSGVVAVHSGQGAALIAVDGQAPKAFKVGQTVVEGLVLQSLGARQARLAGTLDGPSVLTLDMPKLTETATSLRSSQ